MEELYRRPQLGEANKAIDANGFTDWLLCAFPSPFLRPSNHTYIHRFCEAVPNFSASQLLALAVRLCRHWRLCAGCGRIPSSLLRTRKCQHGNRDCSRRSVVCDTSHGIPRTEQIKATLNSLDKHLGPVNNSQLG
jgi:hypothetical protein